MGKPVDPDNVPVETEEGGDDEQGGQGGEVTGDREGKEDEQATEDGQGEDGEGNERPKELLEPASRLVMELARLICHVQGGRTQEQDGRNFRNLPHI